MAAKPKTRGSRPKAKAQSKSDKEQSERFIEAARNLGIKNDGSAFNNTFDKIVVRRKKPNPTSRSD